MGRVGWVGGRGRTSSGCIGGRENIARARERWMLGRSGIAVG